MQEDGVLTLTLQPARFDWQFLTEMQSGKGTFTDAGSQACYQERRVWPW